jgi:hypothetical protein
MEGMEGWIFSFCRLHETNNMKSLFFSVVCFGFLVVFLSNLKLGV